MPGTNPLVHVLLGSRLYSHHAQGLVNVNNARDGRLLMTESHKMLKRMTEVCSKMAKGGVHGSHGTEASE